ncbi:MAG: glycosyltransferase family 4 protein [Candidatus Eisenbacteria bacterium]|nr:glycosyltransferase family 4 protein [Candidatus Eisenbacteria bacterium]
MTPTERPLRVLHVITRMIVGGAQENTLLSCALIDRERFPSEILCGVETGSEGELLSECRARGVPVRLEPALVREVHPWKDLVALVRLVRLLRRERYDVVHVHTSKAGIVGRIAAWCARVPVVIHTAHGWAFGREQPRAAYRIYLFLEALCARLSDAIVVVSEKTRDEALRLGVGRPTQFVLIRSGIEIEVFRDVALTREEARTRIGLPAGAFVIGTVGRLSRQKAPLDLLAAFAPVAGARPEAHLVFVGDGPLRPEVEAAVANRGLTGRVHLLGLRRDVPELLRAFDVFALSSRWEGLPRVFPQAMAAGLPIVATRVDGAAEAVTPGENGWLVDPGDIRAMTGRLLELAADPETARRMGEGGRGRVEEFSARRMVQELEGLYERLAQRRR